MIYFQINLERNFFYANVFRKNLDHTLLCYNFDVLGCKYQRKKKIMGQYESDKKNRSQYATHDSCE